MKNNEFKKFPTKNSTFYYFHDIIKLKNFDCGNILIDEKSHKNILIYNVSYKTLIDPLQIRFFKKYGIIRV